MMFFTDWEGPWVLTDFAYEVAIAVFNNHEFFERLSQYDDYLYLVERREGYEVGDTLRLLAPFLVAADVTSEELREIGEKTLIYTPDAEESIEKLMKRGIEPVVISTSYRQFLEISAKPLGIRKVHCTEFTPENYRIPKEEKDELLEAVEIIASLPEIEIPPDENGVKSVRWLNDFFWVKMRRMQAWRVVEEVKAVGGSRKLRALMEYGDEKPIVIGDSISDVEMLKWARGRGLSVSFNGNEFAVMNSDLAVISETTFAEAYIVEAYLREGMDGVMRAIDFEYESDFVSAVRGTRYYWMKTSEVEEVVKESKYMRRKLRGLAGSLS